MDWAFALLCGSVLPLFSIPTDFTYPNYPTLESAAWRSGARISNNSWGGHGEDGSYNSDAQAYDALVRDADSSTAGNQEMVIVFAAGNDGKNGAANRQPARHRQECHRRRRGAKCADPGRRGRLRLERLLFRQRQRSLQLFQPRAVRRRAAQARPHGARNPHQRRRAAGEKPGADGHGGPVFSRRWQRRLRRRGHQGRVNLFFPDGQQFYTTSTGTSHSTPAVSGGCALLRQYFINRGWTPPSAAMTKAFLMNSARYMTGPGANDTLWSDNQGMGEMDLGMAFDGAPRLLRDELAGDIFTASGQTRTYSGAVADTGKPFRVTLAWTDAPGSTTGSAANNDLDLTVTIGGVTYKGNVFNGAYSASGGSADTLDNVESVFSPRAFREVSPSR